MARESFEREDVAALLNQNFVAVKVDREERPDLDDIFMTATQLLAGRSGWPNSVWLTPDLKPWFAGTYFTRDDQDGQLGFKSVLARMARIWRDEPEDVLAQAEKIYSTLQEIRAFEPVKMLGDLTWDTVMKGVSNLRLNYDERFGGFGDAPKFPPHTALSLLFYEFRRTGDDSLLAIAVRTLTAITRGGIFDQLGGGLHRYSTDAHWFLPHFEKMLYDNAQLARSCVDAWRLARNEELRQAARMTYDWVLREMTTPEGGFYSALDADSEGVEGKYYLWDRDEIIALLGQEEGKIFCTAYGVKGAGNLPEEAGEEQAGRNVLYKTKPLEMIAQEVGIRQPELEARLERGREVLERERNRRVRPYRDDKILTAWNGLMIGSLAYGGRYLEAPHYLLEAEKAADFVLARLRRDGSLFRSFRAGTAEVDGFLDDYAFLASGLLDLHEAGGDPRRLDEAEMVAREMVRRFADPAGGFFYTAESHRDLLFRYKSPYDEATPSGNGMAAQVLIRLGRKRRRVEYRELAEKIFHAFMPVLLRPAPGLESVVLAAAEYLNREGRMSEVWELESVKPTAEARRRPVKAEAFLPDFLPDPGRLYPVTVRLLIDRDWHINSRWPLQRYAPPLTIGLEKHPAAALERVDYPVDEKIKLKFSPEPLAVYQQQVEVKAYLKLQEASVEEPLHFSIYFQACDRERCWKEEKLDLQVPLKH